MSVFNNQSFKSVVEKNGLLEFHDSKYLLLGCNIFFDFSSSHGYAYARGVIPMRLAKEMYEEFKDADDVPFANCVSHQLVNPETIVMHPNVSYNRVSFVSKMTGKSIEQSYKELSEEILEADYDNCYIDFSYIYSPEALEWYICKVKEYYDKKEKESKTKK